MSKTMQLPNTPNLDTSWCKYFIKVLCLTSAVHHSKDEVDVLAEQYPMQRIKLNSAHQKWLVTDNCNFFKVTRQQYKSRSGQQNYCDSTTFLKYTKRTKQFSSVRLWPEGQLLALALRPQFLATAPTASIFKAQVMHDWFNHNATRIYILYFSHGLDV